MLPTITVIGNVQKIETRQTQSGKSVTTVNVSCGEKNAKGEFDNLYIKADFWDKQSDFVSKYFSEGKAIAVTGRLVTTNYAKQDGSKVYETKFLFPGASFVPGDKEAKSNNNYQHPSNLGMSSEQAFNSKPQPSNIPEIDIDENSIPF